MSVRLQVALKRVLDVVVSFIGLLLLAIPFVIIALAIKLDSKGPVFFRQERVGKDGRVFKPYKFRTMVKNAANIGLGLNVAKDDPRITRVGGFLRSWGLDELPQLMNVLKGGMSLVGPRPALKGHVRKYNETQKQRLRIKPGITGWALVNGRNLLTWSEKLQYDVEYTKDWNLFWDIKILFKTIWVVLVTREGLYEDKAGLYDEFNKDL